MPPPPPPKSGAPKPPGAKAPKPPGAKKNKAKKNNYNHKEQNSDNTYELTKTAASAAGTAAKQLFKSFGNKVSKDVKSFTKSELQNAGVDTSKPIIKKPTIKKAAAPPTLKTVNVDWKKKANNNASNKNNKKPPPAPSGINKMNKSKSWNTNNKKNTMKKPPAAPSSINKSNSAPKWKSKPKNNSTGGSMSSKLAMFEANDANAGKIPKPKKIKASKSWGNKKTQERNIKPSFVRKNTDPKNRKKAPPPKKTKAAPPKELKSVNVDWKQQRKKLGAVTSKTKEKTIGVGKMFGSLTKKAKESVTADPENSAKPPPKKMNLSFNTFKKSVSAPDSEQNSENSSDKQPMLPPPPPAAALAGIKSKSFEKKNKPQLKNTHSRNKSTGYSATNNKTNAFKAPDPVKVARPEDYNEIQFKAADPFALKRAQQKKGTGRYARRNFAPNVPTNTAASTRSSSGSVGSVKSSNKPLKEQSINKIPAWKKKQQTTQNSVKSAAKPPPVPHHAVSKSGPPRLPSKGPPPPKFNRGIEKKGVLEAMPTANSDGWIFNEGGMFKVEYKVLKSQSNIFEGSPVMFQCKDKKVTEIGLLKKLDENTIKGCLTKKGKTKYDSKYFIFDSQIEFNGTLNTNAFVVPKSLKSNDLAKESEKIMNAFLNTEGGVLYFGIDKTWNIKGIEGSKVNMTQLQKEMIGVVNTFKPKVKESDLKKIKFSTVAVVTNEGGLKEGLVVIKVSVPGPIKDANGENIIHVTSKGDKFKKNLNYVMKCY